MSSFKNLENLLAEAKNSNIIDEATQRKLEELAQNQNKKSSLISFVNVIGFLGGFAILLGLSLIIAHNWQNISNFTKITTYSIMLAAFHVVGLALQDRHQKIAQIFHFVGAGFVICGVGLIAQIFHLSSDKGEAYLAWFVMIAPLAVILKDKWIGVMAVFALYSWLAINSGINKGTMSYAIAASYLSAISISLILLPKLLSRANSCFDNARFVGGAILMAQILSIGFYHNTPNNLSHEAGVIGTQTIIFLVLDLLCLGYFLSAKNNNENEAKYEKYSNLLLLAALLLPLVIGKVDTLLLSIIYWALWFAFCAVMIYRGAIKGSKTSINLGSWGATIGLLARFYDIIGTMLFTGAMFIIFGVALIAIAYFGEQMRKHFINKYSTLYVK